MSRRNKLEKFAELLTFPNVYENFDNLKPSLVSGQGETIKLKGEWATKHFHNNHPITLELACGKGEYTTGLAARYQNRNFVGVDVKGARIWKGAKRALDNKLDNVAFLRTRIEVIQHFFSAGEVAEIWITFPDPFLRNSKSNRRLTSPHFLNLFYPILQKSGLIHLKTDSPELYAYTLEVAHKIQSYKLLYHNEDIYSQPLKTADLEIKTFYEQRHLAENKRIKYICLKRIELAHSENLK